MKRLIILVFILTNSLAYANLNDDFLWAVSDQKIKKAEAALKKGADINAQNSDGNSALLIDIKKRGAARTLGDKGTTINMIKFLLSKKIDVNAANKNGEVPLYWAIMFADYEAVKLLVENNADVNATDRLKRSIFQTAIAKNDLELLKFLIDAGADINHQDSSGYSALMNVCIMKTTDFPANVEMAKFLIEKGANIKAKNMFEETALDLAKRNRNSEIVKLLEAAGAK